MPRLLLSSTADTVIGRVRFDPVTFAPIEFTPIEPSALRSGPRHRDRRPQPRPEVWIGLCRKGDGDGADPLRLLLRRAGAEHLDDGDPSAGDVGPYRPAGPRRAGGAEGALPVARSERRRHDLVASHLDRAVRGAAVAGGGDAAGAPQL